MPVDPGIFTLKTAGDLLKKLEHDFCVLQKDPMDPYACFNFFVTAEHLPDWHLAAPDKKAVREFKLSRPLLTVCSHLANGAKHFIAKDEKYHLVESTNIASIVSVASSGAKACRCEASAPIRQFTVKCKDLEEPVPVLDLAAQVLEFWREQLGSAPAVGAAPAERGVAAVAVVEGR